jgi:hypothetical protein
LLNLFHITPYPGALALVYFSGHGAQAPVPRESGGFDIEDFLIPARSSLTRESDAQYEAIGQARIEDTAIDRRVITLIDNLVDQASPGIDLYSSFGFNADMKHCVGDALGVDESQRSHTKVRAGDGWESAACLAIQAGDRSCVDLTELAGVPSGRRGLVGIAGGAPSAVTWRRRQWRARWTPWI